MIIHYSGGSFEGLRPCAVSGPRISSRCQGLAPCVRACAVRPCAVISRRVTPSGRQSLRTSEAVRPPPRPSMRSWTEIYSRRIPARIRVKMAFKTAVRAPSGRHSSIRSDAVSAMLSRAGGLYRHIGHNAIVGSYRQTEIKKLSRDHWQALIGRQTDRQADVIQAARRHKKKKTDGGPVFYDIVIFKFSLPG